MRACNFNKLLFKYYLPALMGRVLSVLTTTYLLISTSRTCWVAVTWTVTLKLDYVALRLSARSRLSASVLQVNPLTHGKVTGTLNIENSLKVAQNIAKLQKLYIL